jgi:hypothetical protein
MKVRALPTCRKPVGEGAKRTLGLADKSSFLREVAESGMKLPWYGPLERSVKHAALPGCENDDVFLTPCTENVLSSALAL